MSEANFKHEDAKLGDVEETEALNLRFEDINKDNVHDAAIALEVATRNDVGEIWKNKPELLEEILKKDVLEGGKVGLVLREDGRIVGVGWMGERIKPDKEGHLQYLFDAGEKMFRIHSYGVVPEFRGHNYGERMIREFMRRAKELGGTFFVVQTSRKNEAAVRSYKKAGFVETPTEPPKKEKGDLHFLVQKL